jgi:hypothetical protein
MMKAFDWVTLFLVGIVASEACAQTTQLLFTLGRSKNSNKVCYEAQINRDRLFDAEEPVHAFWIDWAKDSTGKTHEELSLLEKNMVYGCKVNKKVDGKLISMTIVSYPDRIINISIQNGKAMAQTVIDGSVSYLDSIFILYRETRMFPKVTSIELFGRAVKGGVLQYEKIKPK